MKHTSASIQAAPLTTVPYNLETPDSQNDGGKRKRWQEVITSTNMTHNSRKALKTIRTLSNDPTTSNPSCLVSANQVASPAPNQWQRNHAIKPKRPVLPQETEGDYSMVYPFSEEEYRKRVAILKNNKASGRDDVLVEQLKKLGFQSPHMAADNAKQMLHGK